MLGQVSTPKQRELKQFERLVVRLVHYLASSRWQHETAASHQQVVCVLLVSAQTRLAPPAEQPVPARLLPYTSPMRARGRQPAAPTALRYRRVREDPGIAHDIRSPLQLYHSRPWGRGCAQDGYI